MKNISRFYRSSIGFILIGSLLAANIAQASFKDVPNGIAYYYAINWMAKQQVIQGYGDGTFHPDQCVNRVELLKMLAATFFGPDADLSKYKTATFKDTTTDAWYSSILNMAYSRQIIQGYADGTFKPGRCVNRAEAVKMTVSFIFPFPLTAATARTISPQFPYVYQGVDQTDWYAPYINFAAARNILGDEHTKIDHDYKPAGNMSRGEVAEMLYRLAVTVNHDAIAYNMTLADYDFAVGKKTTWEFHEDSIQDQRRYEDLNTAATMLKQSFIVSGKYPDAAKGGTCMNQLAGWEKIPEVQLRDKSDIGVGGCLNNYMYCKLSTGMMLAVVMNRPEDSNAVLSDFNNLAVCDGSGFAPGFTAPGTSKGPWVYALTQ